MNHTAHTGKNLLVIGGIGFGDPGRQLLGRFLSQARSRGCRIHMTDQEMFVRACPEEAKSQFTSLDVLDFTDPAACVAWALARESTGIRFDLVVTARDDAQPAAAAVADTLGLPYNSLRSIEITRNKDLCRAVLAEAGLPQPRWRLCEEARDAREFTATTTGPWVVKPRDGTGSRAVRLLKDAGGLADAMRELTASDRPFVIEEFVEGAEYSAEGLFLHGQPKVVALTAKETTSAPAFVELGHVVPAPLGPRQAEQARQAVERAVAAVGLTFGLFHAEFWVTGDGVVLGELHCRPGGDYITVLIERVHPGLEYFGALFDSLFDPEFVPDLTAHGAAAVSFLTAVPGRVTEVTGWAEASSGVDVVHAHLPLGPGDTVSELRSSLDRCGAVVVTAGTPEAARSAAHDRARTVRIVTTDPTR
ncbi:ATP-grasp domain-containing protein [Streptomyces sp. W16]|uniref:ATP-grasp domain-containing protein n=1 Tax=Streptomyces sp. W16 TaxID=3076631 RepID=UPI00295B083E|nr:ATP-grasp domain-containing protein [Streptomyces sp. W16]MDV9173627.1 ATP-grasp domain-containing protein [Streptomyces sp. W16]